MALCDYFHHEISSDVYHQKIIILNFSFSFISIFAIKKIIASVPTSLFPFLGRQFIISYMHNETQSDYSIQFSSVTQSCPTLCDFMDCITPGFPVLHCLPEFAQTHVHWVNDAIQPSHPPLPSSPPAFSLSQHQGLFQWISSSHQVTEVLEFHLQHQSFQWIFRVDFL